MCVDEEFLVELIIRMFNLTIPYMDSQKNEL
jgi:hypothetical protein